MLLCFELSMPNVGSWNGQWTGQGRLYARIKSFVSKKGKQRAAEILEKGYFHYNFGDGWAAGVSVRQVGNGEAAQIRRKSKGFCGYDWMIDSIITDLTITAASKRG